MLINSHLLPLLFTATVAAIPQLKGLPKTPANGPGKAPSSSSSTAAPPKSAGDNGKMGGLFGIAGESALGGSDGPYSAIPSTH